MVSSIIEMPELIVTCPHCRPSSENPLSESQVPEPLVMSKFQNLNPLANASVVSVSKGEPPHTTELAKKVCPRLRDLATAPADGITQPRINFFGQLCTIDHSIVHRAHVRI